jgi:demethylspheroidene O-methyltransferase
MRDALHRWRDRLLADPRFQRLSAAFPLTRPIAMAHSRAMFDLCAGFVYSQVLQACVALDLFRLLRERPRSTEELAQSLALPAERLARLLAAAQALGLLERRGAGRIGLGMLGAALQGNPGVEAMVRHHALLYADLADPVALLRGNGPAGALASFWGYAGARQPASLDLEAVAPYSRLMSESQQFFAQLVLAAYPFERHRRLLDVGGGDGSFAMAAAQKVPHLRIETFDLPPVALQARARFRSAGLEARASARGGDFFRDPLPGGADLVALVRVVHDHDDDKVHQLFEAVRRTIARGAVLLIAEPMGRTGGAEPIADAYFGMYLLAMGSGRARSFAELRVMLHRSGFDSVRRHRTRNSLLGSVITARPAARTSVGTSVNLA